MSKDSLANIIIKIINKDYKKARGRCRSLSRKKKEKSDNGIMNDTKIYHKMKNKNLLSIEKDVIT